jgi:hypothetical protein
MDEKMTDREYVESRVGACTASYINCGMTDSYWAIRKDSDGQELCRVYCGALAGEAPVWSHAKAIAEVEEEIDLAKRIRKQVEHGMDWDGGFGVKQWDDAWIPVADRLLASAQARLRELKQGMKV